MAKQILNQGRRWYVIHTYSGYEENVAENLKQRSFKEDKILKDAESLVASYSKIEGLKIGAKAGENGKIFGSVNAIQIADAIKEQFGLDVDRKKIEIVGESIKLVGTHKATISVYKGIKAEINFDVVAE